MDTQKRPVFKCVPFDSRWAIPGTKLDLKAIYRRPRRSVDEFDQIVHETGKDGLPLWDLTGGLPLRRHSDWTAKGFQYVTLADMQSLVDVGPFLREQGLNPRDFIQHPQLGPWNHKLYAATADSGDRAQFDALLQLVIEHGIKAVEDIRGQALPPAITNAYALHMAKMEGGQGVGTAEPPSPSAPDATPPKPRATPKPKTTKKAKAAAAVGAPQ